MMGQQVCMVPVPQLPGPPTAESKGHLDPAALGWVGAGTPQAAWREGPGRPPQPCPLSPEITPDLLPRPARLLLLVNPFGGRGLAWQWCKNHVLPMISEAGLSFNLIQTGESRGGGQGRSKPRPR